MRMLTLIILTLNLVTVSAHATSEKHINLSHTYDKTTLAWPGVAPFVINKTITLEQQGFYVSNRAFSANEHAGTHVDAPNHFTKGRIGVSDLKLSQLIGPAIKVDVTQLVKGKPDYLITIEDFKNWEASHGRIEPDTIVLLSTGYGSFWPDFEKYAGTKLPKGNHEADMHFPGLDAAAATWLVTERNVKAVGIDTFSIDRGQTKKFESHQVLTANNIPIFESVADMSSLPDKGFKIYALPMNIKDGTGAPVRIIAEVN